MPWLMGGSGSFSQAEQGKRWSPAPHMLRHLHCSLHGTACSALEIHQRPISRCRERYHMVCLLIGVSKGSGSAISDILNWDVLCLGACIKQIMAGKRSGNFAGGGIASVQKVASTSDEFMTACATIKAAYDDSVIHSAKAIAKRCVPDPLRTKAYGPLQMNVDEDGWSHAFDDESSESFIRRCPPSQGGDVWISMKHELHWKAGEMYYRTRTKSRIGTPDKRMAVVRRKWDECTDKNQISLVNILGQHDYGYGKVRTRMCCINRHVTSQTHFAVDDQTHLRRRRCSLGPRCDSTRCRSARKQRQGEQQEESHLRVCRSVLGRR